MEGPQPRLAAELTIFEKLSRGIRVPFWATCLGLGILLGPPLQFASIYADTGSLETAFALTFQVGFSVTNPVTIDTALGFTVQSIFTAGICVVLYMPKFVRGKLGTNEAELAPLAPGGLESLNRNFGRIYSLKAILITSVILGVTSVGYVYNLLGFVTGPAMWGYVVLSNVVISLVFGVFVWVYFSTLWGLYRLGKEELRLLPADKDPMLGMRSIGSISFTLFISYTAVLLLVGSGVVISPDLFSQVAVVSLEVMGAVLLFLPLNSVHKKMLAAKKRERQAIIEGLSGLSLKKGDDQSALLSDIKQVQVLQLRRDISTTMPTWPFDAGVLGRFAAIFLSVLAILLSRVISGALHI